MAGSPAFLWVDGTAYDLNDLIPAGSGWVLTNATGTAGTRIIGTGTLGGSLRAFLLQPPVYSTPQTSPPDWRHAWTISDLGSLGGGETTPAAINGSGTIVGTSTTASGVPHAFLWRDGTMTDLATVSSLLAGTSSAAVGLNESGQFVGYYTTPTGGTSTFLWTDANSDGRVEDGEIQDLGVDFGGHNTVPAGISDGGTVAGTSIDGNGKRRSLRQVLVHHRARDGPGHARRRRERGHGGQRLRRRRLLEPVGRWPLRCLRLRVLWIAPGSGDRGDDHAGVDQRG